MPNYFLINEFTTEKQIPTEVADKIQQYHINVMNPIREAFCAPILVSQNSGYRSKETELKQGRSGNSEHCFEGKGAADYTTSGDLLSLGKLLIKQSPYTRICYYPHKGFYHCDYKAKTRETFICTDGINWKRAEL